MNKPFWYNPGMSLLYDRVLPGRFIARPNRFVARVEAAAKAAATLDVTVDEEPVNSVFAIPGSEAKLHINRYSMTGKGSITVDLRRLLPTAGRMSMKGGRELVGDDPNRPILQQNEFTLGTAPVVLDELGSLLAVSGC